MRWRERLAWKSWHALARRSEPFEVGREYIDLGVSRPAAHCRVAGLGERVEQVLRHRPGLQADEPDLLGVLASASATALASLFTLASCTVLPSASRIHSALSLTETSRAAYLAMGGNSPTLPV